MAKILVETARENTPCGNYLCDFIVLEGDLIYPARLRDDVYCSSLCRNRHSRRLVQDRRRANPDKNRIDNDRRIMRKYGITTEDLERLWDMQFGRCAICQEIFEDRPHVDHDHATNAVRGLLCGTCNVGLGYFYDDPARLQAAITYLSPIEVGEEVNEAC